MSEVIVSPSSVVQKWRKQAIFEYIRESRFLPYMGSGSASANSGVSATPRPIIQVMNDLDGEDGAVINVPFIARLKGQGVSGAQVLVGNEDDLGNFNATVKTDWLRNAVVVPKSTSYKTEIDLWNAAKPALGAWEAEKLRDNIVQTLGAIMTTTTATDPVTGMSGPGPDDAVYYFNATAAQRNSYLVNNSDRILFGANVSNASSGVWATALGNIDTTNDRASTGMFNLAKRIAKKAGTAVGSTSPHIRPYMSPQSAREYFVAFCATNTFRDIQNDTAMISANRDARAREGEGMNKNPLFQDGDLIYNGIIYVECPELDQLKIVGGGSGGSDVDQNFLCGQQAIGLGWSRMPRYIMDKIRDYEFRPGVAIEECRGQKKLSYNGTLIGIVPILSSSVPDV